MGLFLLILSIVLLCHGWVVAGVLGLVFTFAGGLRQIFLFVMGIVLLCNGWIFWGIVSLLVCFLADDD